MIYKERYIENGGLTCPFCGAGPVEGGFIQVETGFAFQKMCCTVCNGRWQDVFQLVDVVFETGAHAPKRKEVNIMTYVLVTVEGGIIDEVIFFDDAELAVKALEKYVMSMDVESHDAAVYGPGGFIANAKHFLDDQENYTENESVMEDVSQEAEKPIYMIGNPEHRLGFMVASPDDPLGYDNPVEALADLGQMRKDHGRHLKLYRVEPVAGPVSERRDIKKHIADCDVKDFDYSLVEEYLL